MIKNECGSTTLTLVRKILNLIERQLSKYCATEFDQFYPQPPSFGRLI